MICGVKNTNLRAFKTITSNKPTFGQYIIESLIDKNVNTIFTHKNNGIYSPIYDLIENHEDFDIIFNDRQDIAGYNALDYSYSANTLGVVINTSPYGHHGLYKPLQKAKLEMRPLLILSLFNNKNELTISGFPGIMKSFIKESMYIKTTENFSSDIESLLSYSFIYPAGPVHLNISNEILDKEIDL